MSETIDNAVNNFSGGAPESRDFAPSILFAVLLGLTFPLLIWRIFSKKHGSFVNFNTLMFFLLRFISQVLRAYMARRNYGHSILVAELVLVSIAYLFLVNAAIDLWQKHSLSHASHKHARKVENDPNWDQRTMVSRADEDAHLRKKEKIIKGIAWFLRLLLVAALAAAIAAAAILRRDLQNNQIPRSIDALLKASYVLGLATTVLGVIGTIVTHFTNQRSAKHTVVLLSYSLPLLVVGIYRVVEIFSPKLRASRNVLIAFWICVIAFEFIAYSWLLAVSIPKWFGKAKDKLHGHGSSDNEKLGGSHNKRGHRNNDGRIGNATVGTGYADAIS